jgi:hypothetical protein
MNANDLIPFVTLLASISLASERLVEIIKNLSVSLNTPQPADPKAEGRRQAKIYVIAFLSGMLTTYLAGETVGWESIGLPWGASAGAKWFHCTALGILACGGSGLWNSILSYLVKVKDLKGVQVDNQKAELAKKQ